MSEQETQPKVEQTTPAVDAPTTEEQKSSPLASVKSAVENVNSKIVEGAKSVEAEAKVAGEKISEAAKKSTNPLKKFGSWLRKSFN
ncbi:hypothetical protein CANINC_003432 [Pichia inconspicua]|uniref:Uncharacterized protein n=1 Tax=Pichia inconspicua TaxID=52247 RepID=A0A4T0WYJ7_9ASCO|nr:hypothetical protein CANINC_003432 [[Candida] inconspicua]